MAPAAPAVLAGEHPVVAEKLWPPADRSVGRARRFLAQHLEAWGLLHLADTAELIVSELVTNAVTHAYPPYGYLIATRFERQDGGIRIEVHDASTTEPQLRETTEDAESGRGLALVDTLTGGNWGVSGRNGPGKLLWAVCTDDITEATR